MLRLGVTVLGLCVGACATPPQILRGDGASIDAARRIDPATRPRVAVAAILDHTRDRQSLDAAVAALNRDLPPELLLTPALLLSGVRDLLTTELFVSDRFIVLERAALDDVWAERAFARDAAVDDDVPQPILEGADFIVVGAITAIDPGLDGGALPIPFPVGDDAIGVLGLRAARGYIAMDLRVVDARTARVLNATAVEGRHWRFGMDLSGYFAFGYDLIRLPGLFKLFRNTPLEAALQRMAISAVDQIAASAAP